MNYFKQFPGFTYNITDKDDISFFQYCLNTYKDTENEKLLKLVYQIYFWEDEYYKKNDKDCKFIVSLKNKSLFSSKTDFVELEENYEKDYFMGDIKNFDPPKKVYTSKDKEYQQIMLSKDIPYISHKKGEKYTMCKTLFKMESESIEIPAGELVFVMEVTRDTFIEDGILTNNYIAEYGNKKGIISGRYLSYFRDNSDDLYQRIDYDLDDKDEMILSNYYSLLNSDDKECYICTAVLLEDGKVYELNILNEESDNKLKGNELGFIGGFNVPVLGCRKINEKKYSLVFLDKTTLESLDFRPVVIYNSLDKHSIFDFINISVKYSNEAYNIILKRDYYDRNETTYDFYTYYDEDTNKRKEEAEEVFMQNTEEVSFCLDKPGHFYMFGNDVEYSNLKNK